MSWDIAKRVEKLRQQNLLRSPRTRQGFGPTALVDGKRVINLCSNDYLGLAEDPRLVPEIPLCGSTASRLVIGTQDAHEKAERAFASHFSCEDAIMFNSGFSANVSVLPALLGQGDVIFSDELNHASIIDGCRLCAAQVYVFRHRDVEHLESLLQANRSSHTHATIVSESYFSMDGTVADLGGLSELSIKYDAPLIVDDAHACGVLSAHGECENQGVTPAIRIVTLGKAFGSQGAFALGDKDDMTWLRNRARGFVFSTAPPAALADRAMRSLSVVASEEGDTRRSTVRDHANLIRESLSHLNLTQSVGPIIPLLLADPSEAVEVTQTLFDRGIFVQGIRPPTVAQSRLRIVPTALHTDDEISTAINTIQEVLS